MIKIIQDEQQFFLTYMIEQLLERIAFFVEEKPQTLSQCGRDRLDREERCQGYEENAVGKAIAVAGPSACLQRQPGFAAAAGTNEGQQATNRILQAHCDIGQFSLSPNQGSEGVWERVLGMRPGCSEEVNEMLWESCEGRD